LLLKLYEIHSEGALPMNDFATGLELIESFLVRRLVLNYSARSLNRYFPGNFEICRQRKCPGITRPRVDELRLA